MKHLVLIALLCAACKSGEKKAPAPAPAPKPEPAAGSGSAAPTPTPAGSAAEPSTDKPGEKVDTLGYDKVCKLDTDCQVVDELPCNPCNCGSVSIAKADVARFDAAAKAIKCDPSRAEAKCGECKPNKAVCESGRCAANPE